MMINIKNSRNSRNMYKSKVFIYILHHITLIMFIGVTKEGNVTMEICEICNKILDFDINNLQSQP